MKGLEDKSGWELFGILAALSVGIVVQGWALSVLWNWFVLAWIDVPSLTVPLATGLTLVRHYLLPFGHSDDEFSWWDLTARIFIIPPGVVLFGWVIYNFAV